MKKTIVALVCLCAVSPALAQIADLPIATAELAGTTEAISRYQANMILDYVAACALEAQNKSGLTINTKDTCADLLPYSDAPAGLDAKKFVLSGGKKNDSTYSITTPDIESDAVRDDLLNMRHSIMTMKKTGKKVRITFKR